MHAQWIASLKVIGWDLDGTLYTADTSLSQEIDRLKIAQVAAHLSRSLEEAKQRFQQQLALLKSNTKVLDAFGIDGQAFFTSVWNDIDLSAHIRPNPKLAQAFAADTCHTHAILSNSNTPKQVKRKLALIGLAPALFSFILTSTELGVNKPDPQAFQALIARVGVQAGEILYVGDREDVDILPAAKLGMRTAIVHGKSDYADISVDDPISLFTDFLQLPSAR